MILVINQFIDKEKTKEIYKVLTAIQKPDEAWLNELYKTHVIELRKQLKDIKTEFEVVFKCEVHKKSRISLDIAKSYDAFPTQEQLIEQFKEVRNEIKSFREERKTLIQKTKSCFGGAVRYNMIGSDKMGYVFQKKNSVNDLIGLDFRLNIASQSKKPDERQKENFVGIELEIACRVDHKILNKKMAEARLHMHTNCGTDGSIRPDHGDKGQHSVEVRILCKESEVANIVNRTIAILKTKEVDAYVNSSCGLHVHVDARSRDVDHMYNNLVKSLPLLNQLVPSERVSGNAASKYCRQNETPDFKKGLGGDSSGREIRYQAINPAAFNKQKTIEVRLHSGTVNAKKIINWVTILTSIVNHSKTMHYKLTNVEDFSTINNDVVLNKYMADRIAKFQTLGVGIDTATDEITDDLLDKNLANF